jgi:LPXTG-motif cell wall-anchored protein
VLVAAMVAAGATPAGAATTTTTGPATTTTTPTPAFTVTPNAGLHDLQSVTVTGSGFAPGSSLDISQCKVNGNEIAGVCYGATRTVVTTDSSGGFSTPMFVRRVINEIGATVDCASSPGLCAIAVPGASAVVGLTFDSSIPPAGPSIDVQPSTGLSDGETVQVHGVGFTPDADVKIAQCPAGSHGLETCEIATIVVAHSDASGNVAATFVVHTVITPSGENNTPVDCRATPCRLVVANSLGASENADVSLAFGSSALPRTGGTTLPWSVIAVALLVLGAGMLSARRWPRRERDQT